MTINMLVDVLFQQGDLLLQPIEVHLNRGGLAAGFMGFLAIAFLLLDVFVA